MVFWNTQYDFDLESMSWALQNWTGLNCIFLKGDFQKKTREKKQRGKFESFILKKPKHCRTSWTEEKEKNSGKREFCASFLSFFLFLTALFGSTLTLTFRIGRSFQFAVSFFLFFPLLKIKKCQWNGLARPSIDDFSSQKINRIRSLSFLSLFQLFYSFTFSSMLATMFVAPQTGRFSTSGRFLFISL